MDEKNFIIYSAMHSLLLFSLKKKNVFITAPLINQTGLVKGVDILWQEAQEPINWRRLLMDNTSNNNSNNK